MVLTGGTPFQVDLMLRPGAKMSTHWPWLEKYARSSPMVDAPTVTASLEAAGENVHASRLSLISLASTLQKHNK